MSLDILESLSSVLGGPVLRQISASLGESEDGARTAMHSIGPTAVAGLVQQSASPAGATNLLRVMNDDRIDTGIAGKLSGILGNRGSLDALSGLGESLGASVFGNRAGAVTNAISQVSGVKPGSAMTMVSMVLPLLFGMLRKYVTQHGLNASGLTSLLQAQRGSLEKAGLDSRITNALGIGNLSSLFGATTSETNAQPTYRATATPERDKKSRWLPWAIAAGVAALALLIFNRGGNNRHEQAATTSAPAADNAGRTRLASASSTEVHFESGQANIDSEDRREIARIAEYSKAEGRPVAVTGHTDRTGDQAQNLELAKDRATAVRDALVAEGVAESNIEMAPPAVVTGAGTDREARRVDIEVR
jgi:outer membrane protein OmpA-like peptidoglycan-associated protein